MSFGIVVEGPSDRRTYPVLIGRIRNDMGIPQVRECGGKSRLKGLFTGYLKEFQRNPAWNINAAVVIRDSDCLPPAQIEQQLRGILAASGFQPTFPVEFFAIPCMQESWLLSDTTAIQQVAQARRAAGQAALPAVASTPDPSDKKVFRGVLSHFGLPITPQVYGEIATSMDLARIGQRCAYFNQFRTRVAAL